MTDIDPLAQVYANNAAIRPKAVAALAANAAFLSNSSPTDADIVAQVRLLTRECQGLIRLLLGELDTTDGT